ncbi:MAG: 50S ribosomal protein L35 [Candidatus Latescibacteria bacterium]|nr:50S ribosomal protein L35 [Candidatus Latescibacterota bacterium]
MPKIKTHKSTAKRVKRRNSGSLKRGNSGATHYLVRKSAKRKRGFRLIESISGADMLKVKRALGIR